MTPTVLVVDDDPEFRELAGRLLTSSGLTVVGEAGSIAAALAAASRLQPSSVLVDVELPDGDGIALARQLAALPWGPRIVLTSVNGEITTTDQARTSAHARSSTRPTSPTPLSRNCWATTSEAGSRSAYTRQGRCER
jgi:CheY-like chemotaxis protein